jgi:hypothetical protein
VTAAGCPVRQAEHDVYVHAGAVRALGNVTDQRQHVALLVDWHAAILLGRAVEPADGGAGEGADGCDLCRFQVLVAGELGQRAERLITRVADRDVGDIVRVLDNFGFYLSSSLRRRG